MIQLKIKYKLNALKNARENVMRECIYYIIYNFIK
jgi:hypothetical protein